MKLVSRLIIIALLAAFAVSSVTHVAGSTVMAAEMITANDGAMEMVGCDDCGDGSASSLACVFVCNSGGFVAIVIPKTTYISFSIGDSLKFVPPQTLRSLASLPAKQPPRILI
jgi:hypothetical protein